ncbi:unnamed protein product [Clonostachys rhizophaga]|uniref:Metallo-beta-lactamase domain-containing protein n=1 Tax=Clonostachys rhizophaga TaxID=160324 RepID=A0A9N9VJU1_9HYPO|nr:unnamed protein product [Clonostachys rhizophaga]
MPERFFVTPLENQDAKKMVPSLSFLIQHSNPSSQRITRIVFDLGIRRQIDQYNEHILNHVATRRPLFTTPDVIESLAQGGLSTDDIDAVILSHLHWDHVGTPKEFQTSQFIIGSGGHALSQGKPGGGSHNHFEPDLLPLQRTIELHHPRDRQRDKSHHPTTATPWIDTLRSIPWKPVGPFPFALDIFGDSSFFIVWAPGHLPGHLNALCRKKGGEYVYLGGDAAHDVRLITGEKDIATWADNAGQVCCIHQDPDAARETIDHIRKAQSGESALGPVQVILAHDSRWADEAKRERKFFPGHI